MWQCPEQEDVGRVLEGFQYGPGFGQIKKHSGSGSVILAYEEKAER